jgi:pimeloyl-ACP methyl ester carboxylesterase
MTERSESFRRVQFDLPDGRMAGIAFGDETRPPDVLFLHATGFNARTYRVMLEPLGARLHVLAVDLRGHGRSTLPAPRFGYDSWNRHRDDVLRLIDKHIGAPVALAGHSMGATTSLLVAGRRPDLVLGLALIDPVILRPRRYAIAALPGMTMAMRGTTPIARAAARRRSAFPSAEAAVQALTGRGFFKSFTPEMLEDYVTDGVVADGAGVRLSCDPRYEAATFAAQRNDPWRALDRARSPIAILRAEKGSTLPQSCASRIVALRPEVRLATVEGASHALPMERPDRARALIEMIALQTSASQRFPDIV